MTDDNLLCKVEKLFEKINKNIMLAKTPAEKVGWEIIKLVLQYKISLEEEVLLLTHLRNGALLELVGENGLADAETIIEIDKTSIDEGIKKMISEGRI